MNCFSTSGWYRTFPKKSFILSTLASLGNAWKLFIQTPCTLRNLQFKMRTKKSHGFFLKPPWFFFWDRILTVIGPKNMNPICDPHGVFYGYISTSPYAPRIYQPKRLQRWKPPTISSQSTVHFVPCFVNSPYACAGLTSSHLLSNFSFQPTLPDPEKP